MSSLALIDFRDVRDGIRAKWLLYVIALIVAFILAGLLLPVLDRGYVAQATLQLREDEKPTQLSSVLSSLASSGSDAYNSLEAVLASRLLAERLTKRPGLVENLGINPDRRGFLAGFSDAIETGLFRMEPAGRGTAADQIRDLLARRVKLTRAGTNSSVIEVEFAFKKPGLSQPMLAAILTETDAILRQLRIAGLEERIERIDGLIKETTAETTRKALLDIRARLAAEMVSGQSLEPFAFTVIDAPAAGNVRARPPFWLVWVGLTAVLLGLVTAYVVLSVRGRR